MTTPPFAIPEDALLLCVDMQPKFVAAVADGIRVRRRCEFAVAAALGIGIPVAFSEQVPEKLGRTAPELMDLAPRAPFWPKNTFSAFADEGIQDALLRQRDVQHLLLCGIETPVCIYQTAVAARSEGLEVTVLSDAVGARRVDDARVCLDAMRHAGIHVLPSETVYYALLREVGHPFFRSYTQLVKEHSEYSGV